MIRRYRGRARGRRPFMYVPPAPHAVSSEAVPLYRAIIGSIERDGWTVVGIEPDGTSDRPGRIFTVGLIETFQHAELLVFGAVCEPILSALKRLAGQVQQGRGALPLNTPIAQAFGKLPGTLKVVAPEIGGPYAGIAQSRAQQLGLPFSLLQLVRPDQLGRFAWEPGFDRSLDSHQPALYDRVPGRVVALDPLRRRSRPGRAPHTSGWRP